MMLSSDCVILCHQLHSSNTSGKMRGIGSFTFSTRVSKYSLKISLMNITFRVNSRANLQTENDSVGLVVRHHSQDVDVFFLQQSSTLVAVRSCLAAAPRRCAGATTPPVFSPSPDDHSTTIPGGTELHNDPAISLSSLPK